MCLAGLSNCEAQRTDVCECALLTRTGMNLIHVGNDRVLFPSGNLYREDHVCQMNHPDREQNRATIYTRGWRYPKTSRSGLHPRRLLTSATSRRNPSRPWGDRQSVV